MRVVELETFSPVTQKVTYEEAGALWDGALHTLMLLHVLDVHVHVHVRCCDDGASR